MGPSCKTVPGLIFIGVKPAAADPAGSLKCGLVAFVIKAFAVASGTEGCVINAHIVYPFVMA